MAFERLKQNKIWLNEGECKFMRKEIEILGYILRYRELFVEPSKTESIKNCKSTKSDKELRQFSGQANYCQSFTPRFVSTAEPFHHLLKRKSREVLV